MHKSTGIWSKLSPIFNIIFLLHGLVIISFVSIFKWSDYFNYFDILSLIKKILHVDPFDFFTSLEFVEYGLLAIGASITVSSLIGILSIKHGKRWSVIIYFVILVAVFVSHVILLIIFFAKSSQLNADIKDTIRIESNNLVDLAQSQNSQEIEGTCRNFRVLSQLLSCCGIQDSTKFTIDYPNQYNVTLIDKCCVNSDSATSGCTAKFEIIKEINMAIAISNLVLVAYELLFICMVHMIFKSIKRFEEKKFINETYLNFYDSKSYKVKQIEEMDTNNEFFTSIFN